jgi:phage/plasmid-associated DNA primase
LILDGLADTSKTTLALLISEVIGRNNCTELRTSQLDERFETSAFVGKTVLLAPDVKANFLSRDGAKVLKRLVGGDRQSAEFKRANRRVPFDGIFNVIVTSNSRLRAKLEGDADAWRRRLLIIRFEIRRSGARIADFHLAVVRDYGSGILNFMIQGAQKLLESGGRFITTQIQKERVSKFIDESDSLRIFLRSNLAASTDSKDDLTLNEILERYYQACIDKDLNSLPTREANRTLLEIMKELFGRELSRSVKRDGKNQRGFSKVKWREPNDLDPPSDHD